VGFPLLTQGWDNHPECVQQASNKKVSQLEVSSISRSVPARKTLGLLRQKWNDTAAVKTKQKRCTAHILPPTSQLLLVVDINVVVRPSVNKLSHSSNGIFRGDCLASNKMSNLLMETFQALFPWAFVDGDAKCQIMNLPLS